MVRVQEQVRRAIDTLSDRERILVFTGAGISTESGIPDFRGPNGLWKRLDPADFTYERYLIDEGFRIESWHRRFDSPLLGARPNPAHRAVTDLWTAGRSVGCVTQNVAGHHHAAGLPQQAIVELHGNAGRIHCVSCGSAPPFDEVRERWRSGEPDPHCETCGGILKTHVVFFGEDMPATEVERAWAMVEEADAVLVVGSTLSVYPAAFVALDVADRGEPMVIVNRGSTEHDGRATAQVDGNAGEVLPPIVADVIASRHPEAH